MELPVSSRRVRNRKRELEQERDEKGSGCGDWFVGIEGLKGSNASLTAIIPYTNQTKIDAIGLFKAAPRLPTTATAASSPQATSLPQPVSPSIG
jgi:hypothetical protein